MPNQDLRMTSNSSWSTMSNAALRSSATRAVTSWASIPFKYHQLTSRAGFLLRSLPNNYSGIGVADLGCTGVLEFEEGQHFLVILI